MEIVNVAYIGSNDEYQSYSPSDLALINTVTVNAAYGTSNFDYIEYFIKDQSGVVLSSNYYGTQYNVGSVVNPTNGTTSQLYLDPQADAANAGYDRGVVNVKYNFFTKQLLSGPDPATNFWIKNISPTRTEIQVARQDLSNTQLSDAFNNFNNTLAADAYYPDFYLNFGSDIQIIAVNAVYLEDINGDGTIIFKLYEPLPSQFTTKSTFWVVTEIADPAEFNVSIEVTPEVTQDYTKLRGPNFKVSVKDKVGHTTPFYNYSTLLATSLTSSYQQLQSMMQEQGININVDYGNFANFIHFSSATERLYNYVYKQQLIESASSGIAAGQTTTAALLLQQQIDNIITNYDGYEYYLTFTSESTAWPKSNNTPPYVPYSVTSSQVVNWLGGLNVVPNGPLTMSMYYSSSYYDDQNKDLLLYATPSFIVDDPSNQPYVLFLNMIGQMFDNIWIYLKDVTNRYAANNNPKIGISMDLVADALRSFGIQLYTNTSTSDNIYYSILGVNQTGSSLPVTSSLYSTIVYSSSSFYPLAGQPYLSASLSLPPFGDELISRFVTTFITGSPNVTQSVQTLPDSQITAEIYKRIYHNLPYLLKTRGTTKGLQALVTAYGVPDNILTVHEYGGYNIYNTPGIQEISNGMIITGSFQQISASLLSPNVTLQYYNNNLQRTSIDVEVAFTPADSINASITASGLVTSSAQPGYFNIMQQIGAPNLQYSSSYIPLDILETEFFNSEYYNRNNVWDFIRTVKYYNNSLFKMLRDFVPARVSADTGIVIKSHMLERNKYPRKEPVATTSSFNGEIELVVISGSSGGSVTGSTAYVAAIPVQYNGTSSMALTGSPGLVFMSSSNNVQQYNGEFSGSYIQASYNYFSQDDISSYAYPWSSSVAPSEHDGQNILFLTYSVSPLFENVMTPVRSQRFLELDYNGSQLAPTNYGLVTQSLSQSLVIGNVSQSEQKYSQYAYIQDYNYYSRGYVNGRYSGSQLSGLYYNTYSVGDISYGTQPVINWYSDNLGFFTQIATSSFLPGQVNATLGYLADVSGGLFELNQNNKNWVDIQNIFKAGTTATIKQFDNQKYGNQRSTDGIKAIFNSGYNYTPELYYNSGSDQSVYFEYVGYAPPDTGFNAINSGSLVMGIPNYNISGTLGGVGDSFPVVNPINGVGSILNIFNKQITGTGFTPGTSIATPSYTPTTNEVLTFNANFGIQWNFQTTGQSGSYIFNIYDGPVLLANQVQSFESIVSYGSPAVFQFAPPAGYANQHLEGPTAYIDPPFSNITVDTYNVNESCTNAIATDIVNIGLGDSVQLAVYDLYDINNNIIGPVNAIYYDSAGLFTGRTAADGVYLCSYTYGSNPVNQVAGTASFNVSTAANTYGGSNVISFQLTQSVLSTSDYTASLTPGSLTAAVTTVGQGGYPHATTSVDLTTAAPFIKAISNSGTEASIITFDVSMSQYYQYQQVPYWTSGSDYTFSSSLYNQYGNVTSPFNPQFGDLIVMSDFSGLTQVLNVLTASLSGSTNNKELNVAVVPQVLGSWELNPKLIYNFLMLARYDDEQNVILTFNKTPGQTSYGFLIPNTISPIVTNNINTLQAAVQSQLLSNQAATSPTG